MAGCLALVGNLQAAPAAGGDADAGQRIYAKRCIWCHGVDGDGLGPAAERLNPPPRDFTAGSYKIKTTRFDEMVPFDADIYRSIRDGMTGTAMPAWGDRLSRSEIGDLVAYVKTFAGYDEETPGAQVDYGTPVPASAQSIARGKQLFHEKDRCSQCHGRDGKGDASKRLKGDNGERTWPRNLTKPWTFRDNNTARAIFTRISTGIPGTQMPAFADPASNKKLSIEQRWDVANYVHSLADTERMVDPKNTVIQALGITGAVAASVDDPRWLKSPPSTFVLVGQVTQKTRLFTPANDTITVRAMYSGHDIALLLEWDDRTESIPGDAKAEKIADAPIHPDSVAIQFPAQILEGQEKPYFIMGDAVHAVDLWQWTSASTKEPARIELLRAHGSGSVKKGDAGKSGLQASGRYDHGTWRVVMRRPLVAAAEQGLSFTPGRFLPIAFASWDGSNGESGSKHTLSTWYWLLLKPNTGARPIFASALTMLVLAGLLWLWQHGAKRPSGEP